MNKQKIFNKKIQRRKQNDVINEKFETNTIQKKLSNKYTNLFEIKNVVDAQIYHLKLSFK